MQVNSLDNVYWESKENKAWDSATTMTQYKAKSAHFIEKQSIEC